MWSSPTNLRRVARLFRIISFYYHALSCGPTIGTGRKKEEEGGGEEPRAVRIGGFEAPRFCRLLYPYSRRLIREKGKGKGGGKEEGEKGEEDGPSCALGGVVLAFYALLRSAF